MPDLQPFEERSADHLRLVIETSQIGIWELDLRSRSAVRNRVHDSIFGYAEPLSAWTYDQFLEHVVPEDRARVDNLQLAAVEKCQEWFFETQIRTAIGDIRWIKAAGRPLQDDDGNVVKMIGHVMDITGTKQKEARLQLFTEELNHRVGNMLAVIGSMIRMSARDANDVQPFAHALDGRVGALARTHRLLVDDCTDEMVPSRILKQELSAFDVQVSRIQVYVKREMALSAPAVQGLGLVFHELLTNATRYGALSNETGYVEVRIERSLDSIAINWKERGGPLVGEEDISGFGTKLMSKAVAANGTVKLSFLPDGLECHIDLTLN